MYKNTQSSAVKTSFKFPIQAPHFEYSAAHGSRDYAVYVEQKITCYCTHHDCVQLLPLCPTCTMWHVYTCMYVGGIVGDSTERYFHTRHSNEPNTHTHTHTHTHTQYSLRSTHGMSIPLPYKSCTCMCTMHKVIWCKIGKVFPQLGSSVPASGE